MENRNDQGSNGGDSVGQWDVKKASTMHHKIDKKAKEFWNFNGEEKLLLGHMMRSCVDDGAVSQNKTAKESEKNCYKNTPYILSICW